MTNEAGFAPQPVTLMLSADSPRVMDGGSATGACDYVTPSHKKVLLILSARYAKYSNSVERFFDVELIVFTPGLLYDVLH